MSFLKKIFVFILFIPSFSWAIDIFDALTGTGRALTNPGSVEALLHRSLSEDSTSFCSCRKNTGDRELSEEAKARIAERVRKTGILVEEFKTSPLGNLINKNN